MNHYIRNAAITRALIEGVPATALCGDTFVPEHQGKNAVPGRELQSRKFKKCPDCALLVSALPTKAEVKNPTRHHDHVGALG